MNAPRRTRLLVVLGESMSPLTDAFRAARAAAERGESVEVEVVVRRAADASRVRAAVDAADLPPAVAIRPAGVEVSIDGIRQRASGSDRVLLAPDADVDVEALSVSVDAPVTPIGGADASTDAAETTARASGRPGRRRPRSRRRLVHDSGPSRFAATFALAYGFYLLLGDPFDPFDVATGALAAAVVAASLSWTLFEDEPTVRRTIPRIFRGALFVPYLLFEIARASVSLTSVVLRPSLPISPSTVEVRPDLRGDFERAVLANAITLTPGTLTVDVDGDRFLVHALTPATRDALEDGSLERAVRYVFYGRDR
jgi:multicomponent Na+:H+ antiporter subunit E